MPAARGDSPKDAKDDADHARRRFVKCSSSFARLSRSSTISPVSSSTQCKEKPSSRREDEL